MKGLRPKLRVNESNWTSILAKKFRTEELDENPFQPSPGSEAEHYCNATVADRYLVICLFDYELLCGFRVRILKLLCELRCCEDDLRNVLQEVLKPVSRIAAVPRRRKVTTFQHLNFTLFCNLEKGSNYHQSLQKSTYR